MRHTKIHIIACLGISNGKFWNDIIENSETTSKTTKVVVKI